MLPVAPISDQTLHETLVTLLTIAAMGGAIAVLLSYLRRSRPGFAVGWPVAVAFGVRVVAAGVVSLTAVARTLRGGDELTFLGRADQIAHTPLGSGQWGDALVGELHVFALAVQGYFLDSPDLALRVAQVGIAVVGLLLLAAAVYELAGPRASVLAMWLLAFEPASIFFSGLLHKEANMMLAIGLVALGGAKVWNRGDPRYLMPIVFGCLVAVATRPYAGWFLIAAGAAIVLHAGLRAERRGAIRPLSLVAAVALFAAVAAPVVLETSTDESLQENLQPSQEANVSDSSNLALERVDFSTRSAVARNLPRRIRDVLLRPYPWQLGNVRQGLGVLGTAAAYLLLALLIATAIRNRRQLMARAGPLIYLGFFLLIAYSLSAGNAGTAFRYRTQLVAVFICILVALWMAAARRRAGRLPEVSLPPATDRAPVAGV